jgi:hypothetical protein
MHRKFGGFSKKVKPAQRLCLRPRHLLRKHTVHYTRVASGHFEGLGVESGRFHAEGDQTFIVLERWAFLTKLCFSKVRLPRPHLEKRFFPTNSLNPGRAISARLRPVYTLQ